MSATRVILPIAAALLAACSILESTTPLRTLTPGATVVQSVIPSGGATGVDPAAPVTSTFSHPMMAGMEMRVVLHEGSVSGPTVAGASAWSADRTQLTFTPSAPLKGQTTYVLHFSPDLEDATGAAIDWPACAGRVGGSAVSGSSFGASGSGMMGDGGMGPGMGPGMMGSGWQPGSGTWGYGMVVSFATA